MDEQTTVSLLKEKIAKFRDERSWQKSNNPKDLSIALSLESAELLELFLWKDEDYARRIAEDEKQFQRVKEEAADVGIYLLGLSDVLGFDLSDAIDHKLELNARKYPVEKSGGSSREYD